VNSPYADQASSSDQKGPNKPDATAYSWPDPKIPGTTEGAAVSSTFFVPVATMPSDSFYRDVLALSRQLRRYFALQLKLSWAVDGATQTPVLYVLLPLEVTQQASCRPALLGGCLLFLDYFALREVGVMSFREGAVRRVICYDEPSFAAATQLYAATAEAGYASSLGLSTTTLGVPTGGAPTHVLGPQADETAPLSAFGAVVAGHPHITIQALASYEERDRAARRIKDQCGWTVSSRAAVAEALRCVAPVNDDDGRVDLVLIPSE
jgi:hypothetical protein